MKELRSQNSIRVFVLFVLAKFCDCLPMGGVCFPSLLTPSGKLGETSQRLKTNYGYR